MDPIALAEAAYLNNAEDDSPAFENLPKGVQYSLTEIAEKGGDATVFGREVERLLAEENRKSAQSDEADEEDSEIEQIATEDQAREGLNKKTISQLKELAKDLEIEIPAEANKKAEIIDVIIGHLATKEVVEAADAAKTADYSAVLARPSR